MSNFVKKTSHTISSAEGEILRAHSDDTVVKEGLKFGSSTVNLNIFVRTIFLVKLR